MIPCKDGLDLKKKSPNTWRNFDPPKECVVRVKAHLCIVVHIFASQVSDSRLLQSPP
jgi:hypothetical protein